MDLEAQVINKMIDTHCHLDKEEYENFDEIIKNMGKNFMIASGYNDKTNKNVLNLIKTNNNIFGTIGIHPGEVDNYDISILNDLDKMLDTEKIVGVGEIGLDFYWNKDNKDKQKKFFIEQIKLAKKHDLPIVIHSRDANNETLEILKSNLGKTKAILHCYSGSYELAKEFKKLGVKFGIGGVLTFKNSKKLVEVVENLDLSDFVLETDSPYLTPVPFRGKTNQPYNIVYVAEKIAEIKKITFEEVVKQTTNNANYIFNINI